MLKCCLAVLAGCISWLFVFDIELDSSSMPGAVEPVAPRNQQHCSRRDTKFPQQLHVELDSQKLRNGHSCSNVGGNSWLADPIERYCQCISADSNCLVVIVRELL